MSVFFAAVNLSKWIPYAWLGLIDLRNMSTSLVLMPLAPLGVWLGVWAHAAHRARAGSTGSPTPACSSPARSCSTTG